MVDGGRVGTGDCRDRLGPTLQLSRALVAEMSHYIAANRGFPAGSSGEFGRMLYLSATTLTTLGYGDILPITGEGSMVDGG